MSLRVVEGPHVGLVFPIPFGGATSAVSIGRGKRNAVCLAQDPSVSVKHCTVSIGESRIRATVTDLGSLNGFRVGKYSPSTNQVEWRSELEGKEAKAVLFSGDAFEVGESVIVWEAGPPATTQRSNSNTSSAAVVATPHPTLQANSRRASSTTTAKRQTLPTPAVTWRLMGTEHEHSGEGGGDEVAPVGVATVAVQRRGGGGGHRAAHRSKSPAPRRGSTQHHKGEDEEDDEELNPNDESVAVPFDLSRADGDDGYADDDQDQDENKNEPKENGQKPRLSPRDRHKKLLNEEWSGLPAPVKRFVSQAGIVFVVLFAFGVAYIAQRDRKAQAWLPARVTEVRLRVNPDHPRGEGIFYTLLTPFFSSSQSAQSRQPSLDLSQKTAPLAFESVEPPTRETCWYIPGPLSQGAVTVRLEVDQCPQTVSVRIEFLPDSSEIASLNLTASPAMRSRVLIASPGACQSDQWGILPPGAASVNVSEVVGYWAAVETYELKVNMPATVAKSNDAEEAKDLNSGEILEETFQEKQECLICVRAEGNMGSPYGACVHRVRFAEG